MRWVDEMVGGKRDYYKILGVQQTSSMDDIKKAYRMASKKYHPDLNPDLKIFSEEKMRELVEAYETLTDLEKRREYDRLPHFQLRKSRRSSVPLTSKAFTRTPAFKKESSLLERVFSPFFNKKSIDTKQQLSPKDADVHFTLGLSMAENEGFYDQALNEFREAVRYDPGYVEALWNLGILCYRKGLYEEAVINFQKVLSIEKNDPNAKKIVSLLRDDN